MPLIVAAALNVRLAMRGERAGGWGSTVAAAYHMAAPATVNHDPHSLNSVFSPPWWLHRCQLQRHLDGDTAKPVPATER